MHQVLNIICSKGDPCDDADELDSAAIKAYVEAFRCLYGLNLVHGDIEPKHLCIDLYRRQISHLHNYRSGRMQVQSLGAVGQQRYCSMSARCSGLQPAACSLKLAPVEHSMHLQLFDLYHFTKLAQLHKPGRWVEGGYMYFFTHITGASIQMCCQASQTTKARLGLSHLVSHK